MEDIDNIQDPQLRYYYKHPDKYAETARHIDVCMAISTKPCIELSCDLDAPCKRHNKAPEIASRYIRIKKRKSQ